MTSAKNLRKNFDIWFLRRFFVYNFNWKLGQYRTKIVVRLRQRIFRQIVQIRRRNTGVFQGGFVQDDGKFASKRAAKREARSLFGVALV